MALCPVFEIVFFFLPFVCIWGTTIICELGIPTTNRSCGTFQYTLDTGSSIVCSFGNESVEILTHDTTLATLGFDVIRDTQGMPFFCSMLGESCGCFSAEKLAWAIEIIASARPDSDQEW